MASSSASAPAGTTGAALHRPKRKIAVLGSRSVGKSSLVVRYVEDAFVDSYYPTIENVFNKRVKHRNQEYDLDIIDTAGQDEYSILNSKHAIGIHGYVLVFSIANRNSFDMVQTVYDKILNYTGTEHVPCVIVGQKCDLHVQRQVTEQETAELASQLHCAWIETSARHNINISKVFELMLGETDGNTEAGKTEPEPSKCCVM
ncbi:ras-domain-containing protein [Ceraceosorus guamensis]|uniref:Ras-domain-containing protein n=1 Tax=Ceraceosorus guamensis TaxID=1522189 RepID=A0A316WA44_9BASI|nr:ras-domain-containing protein [Ceraceosorus guamensis]PWN46374.1 ras-domain-containing protein [Ceraceosorus guamensis]